MLKQTAKTVNLCKYCTVAQCGSTQQMHAEKNGSGMIAHGQLVVTDLQPFVG